jgi:hypothetical protein
MKKIKNVIVETLLATSLSAARRSKPRLYDYGLDAIVYSKS